ncbi:MAG TPA: phospho-N-acetylmuramoyl-pentapeptide-transferase, partial [Elusimicrobiota bacterium]|nr:phospho-N-acetylmuramoyl-pentapeptide-transferase [Elusimicrobiota bacterium]
MLYYLFELRHLWTPLNVFRYLTVRAVGAMVTSLGLGLALGPEMIRRLRQMKIGQNQRTDGPASHLSKQGTPTMGGLLIAVSVTLSAFLWMRLDVRFTGLLIFVTVALSAIGFWDDYLKLVRKDPKGAPSRAKFAVQTTVALIVVGFLAVYPPSPAHPTAVLVPYAKGLFIELGVLYYVLGVLTVVGASNAVNLTDG